MTRPFMFSLLIDAVLVCCTLIGGSAVGQTLDSSQSEWIEKYKKQQNAPKPEEMLLNTDAEPDLTEGFKPLFNGKDLTGWTPKGGTCTFEVEDGSIIGKSVQGSNSTYLSTDANHYTDFIFTCDMKWDVDGNTGVMFRAQVRSEKKNPETVFGPQAEMEGFEKNRGWSGGVYGQSCGGYFYPLWLEEHKAARAALKPDAWNRITISAKGNVVKTWINGIPAAHWVDNGTYPKGFFGLQIHKGKQGTIRFKNIRVKELNADEPSVAQGKYTIGLSMYSLRQLFKDGSLHAFDYPDFAKQTFGITKIDVWEGGFPADRKSDPEFFKELRKRADAAGSEIFLVMAGAIDARGKTSQARVAQAEKFHAPVDNAVVLGAKFVRVFLKAPNGDRKVAVDNSAETLRPLADYAKNKGIIVVIEPGASDWARQGSFLADVAKQLNHPNCRLMPDFGKMKDHDPYGGTEAMMPYSDGVSAKSHNFDDDGNCVEFDYARLMKTIVDASFDGIVSIEYEGKQLPPVEGVKATQKLLQRFQK
jgi:sugar phosphate isomerase/epimerase